MPSPSHCLNHLWCQSPKGVPNHFDRLLLLPRVHVTKQHLGQVRILRFLGRNLFEVRMTSVYLKTVLSFHGREYRRVIIPFTRFFYISSLGFWSVPELLIFSRKISTGVACFYPFFAKNHKICCLPLKNGKNSVLPGKSPVLLLIKELLI